MPKDKYRDGLWARLQQFGQEPSEASAGDAPEASRVEPAAPKRAVSEAEIMATAFRALSTGEVHIDWEGIQAVSECAPPQTRPNPKGPPTEHRSDPEAAAETHSKEASNPDVAQDPTALVTNPENQPAPMLDPSLWQGRHWREDDAWSLIGDPLGPQSDTQNPFDRADPQHLSDPQKRLLKRFQGLSSQEITELYLRGLSHAHAQKRLIDCITLMRRTHRRYLRVITGKGIGSAGAPVLRRQIISWCILQAHQQRLQWSPEPDSNHEYGAILVDLQQPTRSQ